MDIISVISIVFLVFVEISVLVYLYRNYITTWYAEKWKEKSEEEGWLVQVLEPVILETSEMVSTLILEALKQEYTRNMGTLTRVSKSGDQTPEHMGLDLAEQVLKGMGWKNPPVLMIAKLASTVGGMIKDDSGSQESVEALPTGPDLF